MVFATTPDRPCPFGYKMAWIAIRSRDTGAVAAALGLEATQPANWRTGIGSVYDDTLGQTHVFVSPPVNGWTFVVGLPLPHPGRGRRSSTSACRCSRGSATRFVEVQYYIAYPPVDLFAWIRIVDGKVVRAFAIGDEGVILSQGQHHQGRADAGAQAVRTARRQGPQGRCRRGADPAPDGRARDAPRRAVEHRSGQYRQGAERLAGCRHGRNCTDDMAATATAPRGLKPVSGGGEFDADVERQAARAGAVGGRQGRDRRCRLCAVDALLPYRRRGLVALALGGDQLRYRLRRPGRGERACAATGRGVEARDAGEAGRQVEIDSGRRRRQPIDIAGHGWHLRLERRGAGARLHSHPGEAVPSPVQ